MRKICSTCQREKDIPAGTVCGACRMRRSRARHEDAEGTSREERAMEKARAKREKEDNDARVNALKILGLVGKLKSRMLPEETAVIRAIMEPLTQPVGSIARLAPDALMELVERGDLVEDEEAENEDEGENDSAPVNGKVALTPSELRRDVTAALTQQGFPVAAIEAACNKVRWSGGESLDQMLRAVLAILRPPEPPKSAPESTTPPAPADPEPEPESSHVILPPAIPQWVRAVAK